VSGNANRPTVSCEAGVEAEGALGFEVTGEPPRQPEFLPKIPARKGEYSFNKRSVTEWPQINPLLSTNMKGPLGGSRETPADSIATTILNRRTG